MDVGYVEPLKAHQLRNEGHEPFGFFCIVDHQRDRPMSA
jgi:ribulose-bisphosphate carboxylase large chain